MLLFFNRYSFKTLRKLLSSQSTLIFCLLKDPPPYLCTQKSTYVDVYMKWKKDPLYDSIQSIHHTPELKPLISLKNCIAHDPNGCIAISAVSKRSKEFGLPIKVARFMRLYPSVFEEFVGLKYDLPWFRLTPKAVEIHEEETKVYEDCKLDLRLRLKKLIMMSREKKLPLKVIRGLQWYLGLPDDFLENPEANLDGSFVFVEMEGGERGLAVECGERMLSSLQKNAIKREVYNGERNEPIPFPLFPSKGLRLKRKISDWLDGFQKLPYVSPYEDFSHFNPSSDTAEKRVVGVLHELLSLFVEHAAERKKLLCLKKYMGLPQKFHKAFERHPHIFYLSLRNKTCTAILKEAYKDKSAIERHPLSKVRDKYIKLMNESRAILKQRRQSSRRVNDETRVLDLDLDSKDEDKFGKLDLDLDSEDEEKSEMGKSSL
ncbi:wtf element Wtf9 [Ancistrocladus abbreviatus]